MALWGPWIGTWGFYVDYLEGASGTRSRRRADPWPAGSAATLQPATTAVPHGNYKIIRSVPFPTGSWWCTAIAQAGPGHGLLPLANPRVCTHSTGYQRGSNSQRDRRCSCRRRTTTPTAVPAAAASGRQEPAAETFALAWPAVLGSASMSHRDVPAILLA